MPQRLLAWTAVLLCLPPSASAFHPAPRSFAPRPGPSPLFSSDPTKSWYAGLADGLSNLVTNSPLNEGKKALVRQLAGDYDRALVRARLDGLIADSAEGVLMLSFTRWPFCVRAKDLLEAKGAAYEAVELDTDVDGKGIRAEMADLLGRTSVPAIWIGGTFVGGCNDGPPGYDGLMKLEDAGKLDDMLKEAGAL